MRNSKSLAITANMAMVAGFMASKNSFSCPECKRLDANVEFAVKSIRLIMKTKFDTIREKLQLLHEWQCARDSAMETLYVHKKSHDQGRCSVGQFPKAACHDQDSLSNSKRL